MDDIFSFIFFIWIAYSLLEGLVRKKQMPKLPPDQDQTQQDSEGEIFEIPTLANDPNLQRLPVPSEEVIEIDQTNSIRDILHQRQAMLRSNISNERSPQIQQEQTLQQMDKPNINLNFTPTDTMNAMILSEIFNKPKALRKH